MDWEYINLKTQEDRLHFLEDHGFNFLIRETYWGEHVEYTPLYYACIKGEYDIVQYLLEHGASPTQGVYDDYGIRFDSPWGYATGHKNAELINLIKPYIK